MGQDRPSCQKSRSKVKDFKFRASADRQTDGRYKCIISPASRLIKIKVIGQTVWLCECLQKHTHTETERQLQFYDLDCWRRRKECRAPTTCLYKKLRSFVWATIDLFWLWSLYTARSPIEVRFTQNKKHYLSNFMLELNIYFLLR